MTDRTAANSATPWRRPLPWFIPRLNPIARAVLHAGAPLGPNALVTIVGRRSGLPRTTPLAIIDAHNRRWVWSPYGDVDWVRNLRASGRATITHRRRTEEVIAIELDHRARVDFFRNVLRPKAHAMAFGVWFIRSVDGVDPDDPETTAVDRPVFELVTPHPMDQP
jgi:deazaflavin-dependent oxidoreductase (nitroreductase family)